MGRDEPLDPPGEGGLHDRLRSTARPGDAGFVPSPPPIRRDEDVPAVTGELRPPQSTPYVPEFVAPGGKRRRRKKADEDPNRPVTTKAPGGTVATFPPKSPPSWDDPSSTVTGRVPAEIMDELRRELKAGQVDGLPSGQPGDDAPTGPDQSGLDQSGLDESGSDGFEQDQAGQDPAGFDSGGHGGADRAAGLRPSGSAPSGPFDGGVSPSGSASAPFDPLDQPTTDIAAPSVPSDEPPSAMSRAQRDRSPADMPVLFPNAVVAESALDRTQQLFARETVEATPKALAGHFAAETSSQPMHGIPAMADGADVDDVADGDDSIAPAATAVDAVSTADVAAQSVGEPSPTDEAPSEIATRGVVDATFDGDAAADAAEADGEAVTDEVITEEAAPVKGRLGGRFRREGKRSVARDVAVDQGESGADVESPEPIDPELDQESELERKVQAALRLLKGETEPQAETQAEAEPETETEAETEPESSTVADGERDATDHNTGDTGQDDGPSQAPPPAPPVLPTISVADEQRRRPDPEPSADGAQVHPLVRPVDQPPSILDGAPSSASLGGSPAASSDAFESVGQLDALQAELSAASGGSARARRRIAGEAEVGAEPSGFSSLLRPPAAVPEPEPAALPKPGPRRVVPSRPAPAGSKIDVPMPAVDNPELAEQLSTKDPAEVFASEGSGRISGLAWADGLVEIEDGAATIRPGDPVRYIPYASFR